MKKATMTTPLLELVNKEYPFVLFVILCITGCVYYNTLYNAKEYYEKAIVSSPPNKEFLDKSIQKCEKIVEYHSDSKYIPDALFLMGKCFLAKEEYDHAIRKFHELIAYYPQHKLAQESRLELGKTYLAQGEYLKARNALKEIKDNSEEIAKLTMDSYFGEKEYEKSINVGNKFISRFPKSKLRVEVLIRIGDSYDSVAKFDSALKYYEEALKLSTKKFQLSLSIGNILIALNKYDEALQKLIPLRELANAEEKPELELRIAKCYKAKGEGKEALKILEPLENSPEAQYEAGVIYEEELSEMEKAREHYEQARKLGGSSKIANQALSRASRISKLAEYREGIKDSTKIEDLARTQFLLAELYWVEFNQIDEAIQEYERINQNFPQSEYAAKAAYSIAWLLDNEKKDKEKAILAYERVEKEFPNTQYAEYSKERLTVLRSKGTSPDEGNKE